MIYESTNWYPILSYQHIQELTHFPFPHADIGTGKSYKEKFRKENWILSYYNHQLIKSEEEKRFGL